MSPHPPGEDREILLLKLKTVEPLIKSLEEWLSQMELDLSKATALHPFDPAEQVLFLSRAEIRPGEFTPSHSLIVADLERAARSLGVEFSERWGRATNEFWGHLDRDKVRIYLSAGPEKVGPLFIEFLRTVAALIRIRLKPALLLRGEFLDRLNRPEPVKPAREQPRTAEPIGTVEAGNVFRRDGNDWSVRFRQSKLFALKANAGAFYVHHLLQRPGQEVPVGELAACWDRIQRPGSRPATGEVASNRSGDDGPVMDDIALRQVYEEWDGIGAELEDAEKNNDTHRATSLRAERQRLAQSANRAKKPDGRPVLVGEQHRRITDKVRKAIHRTIATISGKDDELGRHLESAVTTGAVCEYAPQCPTPWDL